MTEFASPENLKRRRSLEPIPILAEIALKPRSISLPPLENSNFERPYLMLDKGTQSSSHTKLYKVNRRIERASSVPIIKPLGTDLKPLNVKRHHRVRSNSTSSYFPPTSYIRTALTRDHHPTNDEVRNVSPAPQTDKEERALDVGIRSDAMDLEVARMIGTENETQKQAQIEKESGDIIEQEIEDNISGKAKTDCYAIDHQNLSNTECAEETPQANDIDEHKRQSFDLTVAEQSSTQATPNAVQSASPPRPTLHPVASILAPHAIVPPLDLPPSIRPLEPAVECSRDNLMEEQDSTTLEPLDQSVGVGGDGILDDTMMEEQSSTQVIGTCIEREMTERFARENEGEEKTISQDKDEEVTMIARPAGEGDKGTIAMSSHDAREPGSSQATKAISHVAAVGTSTQDLANAAVRANPDSASQSAHIIESVPSLEGRKSRSTSLPPMRGDLRTKTRVTRSNSFANYFTPVFVQPLALEVKVVPSFSVGANIAPANPTSLSNPGPRDSALISNRPRPRCRSRKRKPLSRSASQEYIREPQAKRIKLRSTSIDSAVSPLRLPAFGDAVPYLAGKVNIEKTRQDHRTPLPGNQNSLCPNPHLAEEEMNFEEAQAALTLSRRGMTIEDAMESFRYPETPRAGRTLNAAVEMMSSYPSTPALIADSPGDLHSSPPCHTPASGERLKKRKAEDEKSQRALKKPFKPPLAPGKVLQRYLGSSSPPFVVNTDLLEDTPSRPVHTPAVLNKTDQDIFPTFETAHSKRYITKRLTKPFKSPSVLAPMTEAGSNPQSSDPIEPPSSPTRAPKRYRPVAALPETLNTPSRSAEITALETRKQTLTQALKIINNQDEEARLTQLREQWLAAGREISEKLFSVIPEPTDENEPLTGSSQTYQGYYHDDPLSIAPDADEDVQANAVPQETMPKRKDWTIGSMLEMLSVDPDLFGWNEENEDWQE